MGGDTLTLADIEYIKKAFDAAALPNPVMFYDPYTDEIITLRKVDGEYTEIDRRPAGEG